MFLLLSVAVASVLAGWFLANPYATGPDALSGMVCMAAGIVGAAASVLAWPDPAAADHAFVLAYGTVAASMVLGGVVRLVVEGPGAPVARSD